jgi:glyoxylase-like metal-dependent hydrolase (beta-lactamase superfamily II)/rhodanese-related sulfurtransferase
MALVFHQVFEAESCTYTYIVGDSTTGEAALIDGVLETAPRDEALLRDLGLKLKYSLETHCHADHVSSGSWFQERCGSAVLAHRDAAIGPARPLVHGEIIRVGDQALRVLHTPGHTAGDVCYALADRVFSGDTLLIGGCGRTDFQQGNAGQLYDSIHAHLFTLRDATQVYPAHDYKGRLCSTIGAEKRTNPRLAGTTREQFIAIMKGLNLAYPKQIDRAVPANQRAGAGVEPFTHPVKVAPDRFFAIPELALVVMDSAPETPRSLPVPVAAQCCEGTWNEVIGSMPKSRTVGLVCRSGTECGPLEAELTRRGYDVVVLEGGLHAWQMGHNPAGQTGVRP